MLISTKGTYALRAMSYIAKNNGDNEYICLSCIANNLCISRKYLESIMTLLAKNKLVDVCLGKCGGYKLNRPVEEYSLFDILIATEQELKTTPCNCIGENSTCNEKSSCSVLNTYNELHEMICDYLKKKTIKDLI